MKKFHEGGCAEGMTDYELVRAVVAGETDFFAELVDRYKNLVFSIILRQIRDHEEVADFSQDVFLKIYKNLEKYTPEYKFSTWVMKITANHIIDMRRKKKFETVELASAGVSAGESAEEEFLRRDEAARISKLVASLPEIYKVPVVLYHRQGMSYMEIAEKIGEPLSKIKNRIFRGRKLLKTLLTESEM